MADATAERSPPTTFDLVMAQLTGIPDATGVKPSEP